MAVVEAAAAAVLQLGVEINRGVVQIAVLPILAKAAVVIRIKVILKIYCLD